MNAGRPHELDDFLDDCQHSHIFVEYDQNVISQQGLTEAIELTGTKIVKAVSFPAEQNGNRYALFRLNIQDVREVVLSLLDCPLIAIKGYNAKSRI